MSVPEDRAPLAAVATQEAAPLLDIRGLRVDFPDIAGSAAIDGMDLR